MNGRISGFALIIATSGSITIIVPSVADNLKSQPNTSAAEKDAADIMHSIGRGADMTQRAATSFANNVHTRMQSQRDTPPPARDGMTSSLEELRNKTENDGRQIANSLKSPGKDDNTNNMDRNIQSTDTRTQHWSWSPAFSDLGRDLGRAMADLENAIRTLGEQVRAQFAKTDNHSRMGR